MTEPGSGLLRLRADASQARAIARSAKRRHFGVNAVCGALAQRTEERADLGGQRLRLLERSEMSALRHYGPALDVEHAFRGSSRRAQNLARKLGIAGRNVDAA